MTVMNLATLLGKQQSLLSGRNALAFALMCFADMLHSSRSFACLFLCVKIIKLLPLSLTIWTKKLECLSLVSFYNVVQCLRLQQGVVHLKVGEDSTLFTKLY
jgi:hypothetical protein